MNNKIIIAIISIACSLSLISCEKAYDMHRSSNDVKIECLSPNDTKTHIDGLSVVWDKNDKIYVSPSNDMIKKTYQLQYGENTSKGTFAVVSPDVAYESGTEVIAFTETNGFDNFYCGEWCFDICVTPTIERSKNLSTIYVPMVGKGKIGETVAFDHLASVICFEVCNPTSTDMTISKMIIDSDRDFTRRVMVKYPQTTTYQYNTANIITSSGSDTIMAGETNKYYFILYPNTYPNFSLSLYCTNGTTYDYKSSSLVAQRGHMHAFVTNMDEAHKRPVLYQISIDGGQFVAYDPICGFPSAPSTSIAIKSITTEPMTDTTFSYILNSVNALSKVITVDFSEMTNNGVQWKFKFVTDNVSDVYLPGNVTEISEYLCFGGSNCKLHIGSQITKIEANQFNCGRVINDECGFVLDPNNDAFKLVNGWLYDSDGVILLQVPTYSQTDIIIPEGVTELGECTMSNNHIVETITCPSSLTKISHHEFSYCKKLHTIFMKAANPPQSGSYIVWGGGVKNGKIVIDTGDAVQDITSKELYQNSKWGIYSQVQDWTIVTKAEYLPALSATAPISDLNDNKDYKAQLW